MMLFKFHSLQLIRSNVDVSSNGNKKKSEKKTIEFKPKQTRKKKIFFSKAIKIPCRTDHGVIQELKFYSMIDSLLKSILKIRF